MTSVIKTFQVIIAMMEGSVVATFLVASVSVTLFFFSLSETLPHDELSGLKV